MKRFSFDDYIPLIALLGIVTFACLHFLGYKNAADTVLLVFLAAGTLPLFIDMLREIFRGRFGVDIIAMIAIVASLFLKQYLAGIVILLMLSGGEALEDYALRRARKELTALLSGAPTIAHLKNGEEISDVPIEQVKVGQTIVVKPGEIIPVDGVVISGVSMIDQSAITGESLPIEAEAASQVLSGSVNQSGALEIIASHESRDSKYQQLVRLVRQAEENKAPIVRLADRYTVFFTIATFILALFAWLLSKDSTRVLAVLVVATPCPLILATPIAIISGISRSAKRGIIVKDGGALERLGEAKAFVFDKTGTITLGAPEVTEITALDSASKNEILKIAASLDQLSTHILARSLLDYSKHQKIALEYPQNYKEYFGDGVSGEINGEEYYFGRHSFLEKQGVQFPESVISRHETLKAEGIIAVYLSRGKSLLGAAYFTDKVRPESKHLFNYLRQHSLRAMMLTGDRREVAEHISEQIGLKEIYAESLPEQKMEKIAELQQQGFSPVAMIGDGINDAAALAAADVGIAMGARGSSASSEAGDIVIAVDNLQRVEEAYSIAKNTLNIALQGIFAGMGLSIVLMVLASLGYIQPVFGALLQEGIDVLVILNALRPALKPGPKTLS